MMELKDYSIAEVQIQILKDVMKQTGYRRVKYLDGVLFGSQCNNHAMSKIRKYCQKRIKELES